MDQNKDSRYPQQDESEKIHGTPENDMQREKYIRDSGKIEDLPSQDELAKMKAEPKQQKNESSHLTDRSGEEKKEDYINTDERKKDLDNRGL